jgi:hypothetical protein
VTAVPPNATADAVERGSCSGDQVVRIASVLVAELEGVDPEKFDVGENQDRGYCNSPPDSAI